MDGDVAVGALIVTNTSPLRFDPCACGDDDPAFLPQMTIARQRLGRHGEDLVAARLARLGWSIVDRNVRLPSGELDLVALDGQTVVFVEVKAGRKGSRLGPERPAHAVGRRKQLKLRLLAREWLAEGRGPSGVAGYRFDVVGVSFAADGLADVDHIRNAF